MGRLGESVREKQGLAYTCFSTQDAELIAGTWFAGAGVNPADVEQAIAAILHEFERLGDEPVPADELRDSQDYMTGVVPLALETNAGVATTLLNMEWFGLGLDYLQRYSELIYAVTVEDVQRVARQYLRPDRSVLVVAGPSYLPQMDTDRSQPDI
jgi:zinc protease